MKKINQKIATTLCCIILTTGSLLAQLPIIVKKGLNNAPITRVVFDINNAEVTQNTPANNGSFVADDITVKSIDITDNGTAKTLQYFNLGGNVVNNNFTNSTTGVSVFEGGQNTTTQNPTNFEVAVDQMCSDSNLLHILRYDNTSNIPLGADFDIMWDKGLLSDDFIVLGERNGNSSFTIQALDKDGKVIMGANNLRFERNYDWNTGYSPSNYNRQPMHITVAKVDLFNTSTPVHGFRIDNDGGADIRFFMMGDNTFDDNPRVSLPIELTTFDAKAANRDIDLTWSTASEINGDYFEVQYSNDGLTFETLGYVDAVGESRVLNNYEYTHTHVGVGNHYYRLKMVDNDETFEYSHLVVATIQGVENNANAVVFPNPAPSNQFSISFEEEQTRTIQVVDMMGSLVYQIEVKDKECFLELHQLPAGVYNLVITNQANSRTTQRIVLGGN